MDKDFDVIVAGELNVDLILNDIESFPEIGKEKLAGEMTLTLGSSAAIFASNLSSLETNVAFLGKIGHDEFGTKVLDSLGEKGVETELIIQSPDLNTGATIVLNFDEDRAMVTHPGAMEHLTIDDISEEQLARARHLHFSSYFLQPGIKPDIVTLFKMAKDLGLTTSIDPQWDPAEEWDLDLEHLLPYVDVFLPNETELKHLTGIDDIDRALDKLKDYGHGLVVKMGNQGSLTLFDGERKHIPPFLNEDVVDAIGAGDSFNAGFVSKFIQGKSIEECQEFGNLTGAISTTAAGGTTAFTNYGEIMNTAKTKFGYNK